MQKIQKWFLLRSLVIFLFVLHNSAMSESTILVRGALIPGGLVCPLFRTEQGQTLSLTGLKVTAAPQGAVLHLTGRWEVQSVCMQAFPTLRVEHISFQELAK